MNKPIVAISLLGSTLDAGFGKDRWQRWRPTVGLGWQSELPLARLELLHHPEHQRLAETVAGDVREVSPGTDVRRHPLPIRDPWDFVEVYGALHDWARGYAFDVDREDYLVHITTGTHVAQICLFLLTESRRFPARLAQTAPGRPPERGPQGSCAVIDLDLSKYDALAARFRTEQREGLSALKGGIDTKNAAFNKLIEQIERVAVGSRDPILLTGPTGAGKSLLARRIWELKKAKHRLEGPFVEVNCATLRGDGAMSALFGHAKGAFTGAVSARPGLLRKADGGLLFLDEVGELGPDEQAMLLRALEEKRFLPLGSDDEERSDFQLIVGTNRDLSSLVRSGAFREDLLARVNLWSFRLPALRERPEDIAPNFDYELDRVAQRTSQRVTCSKEARDRFLSFASSAPWPGNFRDLAAAVSRMATLSIGGRISQETVDDELTRLQDLWAPPSSPSDLVSRHLPNATLDLFDRAQLEAVLQVCATSRSLSEAGRTLFAASRARKSNPNDADRLRKYLSRFGLSFEGIQISEHRL